MSEHKTEYLIRQTCICWRRISSEKQRMTVVGTWILALLKWLCPVQCPVSVRPRALTPVLMPAWSLQTSQPLLKLAPIHYPTHRRRP